MRVLLVLCLALTAGCSPFWRSTDPQDSAGTPLPNGLEQPREAAVIEFHREPVTIEIPSQVERGR